MLIEEKIVGLLLEKNYTITTVESCTGGLLIGTILNVSGASGCVNEGYITYSNEAKERIVGVQHETLEEFGAVSEQTAREMAIGGANVANSNVVLSVTGVAGPGGASAKKPVGLTYIGCCINGKVVVKQFNFSGKREQNRRHSVREALKLAISMLEE
ncbi:MAG: CinA family protein [Eubacteriales bacterium]